MNDKFLAQLAKNGIDFKDEEEILPKSLNSKKRLGILSFSGKNGDGIAFFSDGKSRILTKDFVAYEELVKKANELKSLNIKEKILFFQAPMCSKAKVYAKNLDWIVIDVSL